jgi:cytochrome P450
MEYLSVALGLLGLLVAYSIQSAGTYFVRRKLIRERGCQPPTRLPQKDPVFGLDIVFKVFKSFEERRRNMTLKELVDEYGCTHQSKPYGATRIFSIEPQNLQAVFATDFGSFGVEPLRLFNFKPFIGKGIMNSDGAFWEHSRALIKPTFARTQISDLSSLEIHVSRLIDLIPKDGSTVDLQPLFARLALDSSTEFLLGESVRSLAPDSDIDAKAFLAAYNYGQAGVGKRMQLPSWNIFTLDKKFWKSCKIASEFVDKYVDRAVLNCALPASDAEQSKYILAYELAKQTGDRIDIRNQLLNVFLPGHEATGVALTNIFFLLARHPKVWAKLRREILSIGTEVIKFERLKSLKYLQAVMNETFRLHPAVGTMARAALRDTVLPTGGGTSGKAPILVLKGDVFATSFYALHRRRDVYGDDADIFRPERWEPLRPAHWTYMPFGGGPRICPGQQLALTEVAYTTVRLLQRFEGIENRDDVLEFVEQYKISTESRNGAKVSFLCADSA